MTTKYISEAIQLQSEHHDIDSMTMLKREMNKDASIVRNIIEVIDFHCDEEMKKRYDLDLSECIGSVY